ncbi:HAD family hydrolase [Mumia sp. Pv 4-285]|uniref:HAD family hydrolase n=1 Tax=Mumia qirimensis TaxID=3234852 RepID=UPI00351D7546
MAERAAVLFDIDGTLVDSNYLHVQAWRTAFRKAGITVDDWRVHRAIGMDGDRLLDDLAGGASEADRTAAKDLHASEYADLAGELRRFDGTRPLLRELRDRGVLIVLATSAPPDELARLRKALDCDDLVDAVTNADDVEDAKPQPDIVQAALDKVDVDTSRAVLVGDAVWDGLAAQRAGVPFLGVRTGGAGPEELRGAGAAEVYDDVSVLHGALDASTIGRLLR